MKNVLIMTSGLTHGGVNRSLLNFLEVMSQREYNFEVFSLYTYGPYLKLFKNYNLLTVYDSVWFPKWVKRIVSKDTKCSASVRRITDFVLRVLSHLFHERTAKSIAKSLSKFEADVVISFQEGYTTEIVSFVEANKLIAWVHCDYSRYINGAKKDESNIYERYSNIVCVSEYTASVFRSIVPAVGNRVVAIHNIMDSDGIKALSLDKMKLTYQNNILNLVSVGRLDPVKRFSYIPSIAKKLKDNDVDFKWYIIGDGGAEKDIVVNRIKENSVEDYVVLLGELDNPYPYIRNASALVCLSSSEACPNVINEAKILHTPIVTTDFPSVSEYVSNNDYGFVAAIEDIHSTINNLLSDDSKYRRIKEVCNAFEYDNTSIVSKIVDLIDD
ncbi:glycosyltransferase involved in cell wall biosynthesis [Ruminococcaceae bacterium R-25]|nr:glycosyltransferase involved in cell wall biosynthesis [Ruminococcaceae bacterium R-25]SUQ11330.1 Glycosyltransferase involved in cell wall bisynthesis [Oscillospiraceae bacterium]